MDISERGNVNRNAWYGNCSSVVFRPLFLAVYNLGTILAVNKRAEILLGKPKTNLLGLLGGEALECVNASTPEGCGNTVHCVTCSIRKAVITTIESGILHRHIPVKLQREDGEIAMYLSTEIIGSSVCIKISSGK